MTFHEAYAICCKSTVNQQKLSSLRQTLSQKIKSLPKNRLSFYTTVFHRSLCGHVKSNLGPISQPLYSLERIVFMVFRSTWMLHQIFSKIGPKFGQFDLWRSLEALRLIRLGSNFTHRILIIRGF